MQVVFINIQCHLYKLKPVIHANNTVNLNSRKKFIIKITENIAKEMFKMF
jgi:hypothetical protein